MYDTLLPTYAAAKAVTGSVGEQPTVLSMGNAAILNDKASSGMLGSVATKLGIDAGLFERGVEPTCRSAMSVTVGMASSLGLGGSPGMLPYSEQTGLLLREYRDALLPSNVNAATTRNASVRFALRKGGEPNRQIQNLNELKRYFEAKPWNSAHFDYMEDWKTLPALTNALWNETRVLIGIEGAALSNLLFLRPGSVVVVVHVPRNEVFQEQGSWYYGLFRSLGIDLYVRHKQWFGNLAQYLGIHVLDWVRTSDGTLPSDDVATVLRWAWGLGADGERMHCVMGHRSDEPSSIQCPAPWANVRPKALIGEQCLFLSAFTLVALLLFSGWKSAGN